MSVPLVDSSQLAAAGNLSTLKQAAASGNPQALREAARQFESLFTSMMLKSMQEANFKDPVFGSDQGDLYQEMYDDQVAAQMSKGKGLGLADMLVQQLRRAGIGGADPTATTSAKSAGSAPALTSSAAPRARAGATGTGTSANSAQTNGTPATASATSPSTAAASATSACPSSAQQAAFAQALWPDAQQAAKQLGVNPVTLLAQAALETNWGRSVPQAAGGASSNNLFGIKAASGWSGPAVSSSTLEYSGGSASTAKAQFRSYGSASQCFQDYVDLLKGNPRYAAALSTGDDVQAFGSALQQGGYATDPAYASKLTAVAGTLTRALTQAVAATPGSAPAASLKFAGNLPTTDGSGTLQRR
jgi:flagellar protein FlgJ